MAKHLLVVFTNPVEGQEAEYNKWYDEVHVPELLEVPNVVGARRLEATQLDMPGAPTPEHGYLALYELDGDPGKVLAELNGRMSDGRMTMSPALDAGRVSMSIYTYRDQG